MKKIASIVCMYCFAITYCQNMKTDSLTEKFNSWSSQNLNKKAKEIIVKTFKVDTLNSRIISKKPEKTYNKTKFSITGQELIYEVWDKENTIITTSSTTYKDGKTNEYILTNMKEESSEKWIVKKHLFNFYPAEMECYINNKIIKKAINSTNEKGLQTAMKIFDNKNRLIHDRKLEYDKNGNLIKIIDQIKTKNLQDTIYITSIYKYLKFDKNNNWTVRIDKINDDFFLTERQIEYY